MNIAVFDVDGLQTCFGLVPSAFEIIELGYTDCALKENFSVTLTKNNLYKTCQLASPFYDWAAQAAQ